MSMIGVFALLMLAPAAGPTPAADSRPQLLVVVRQDAQPPLAAGLLRRIADEAQEIWRPYLDIAFRSADDLAPFRGDDTLELLLTDRQSNGRVTPGLGWIDFVDGDPSRAITVSVGAAKALAEHAKFGGRALSAWPPALRQLFLTRSLARSVAHEIGHYLLRSKDHTAVGLMRARFTVDEIMTSGLRQYRLQPAEVDLVKQRSVAYALARRNSESGIRDQEFANSIRPF
jgi:hypothetical protein